VSVEVKNEQLLSGYCTGSYCSFSSLEVHVTEIGDQSQFQTFQEFGNPNDPSMYGSFQGSEPYPWMRAEIARPGNWNNHVEEYPYFDEYTTEPWPDFLMAGSGQIRLALVTSRGCILNCDSIESGIGVSPPRGLSELRIIVEGVAAPEPSAMALLLIAMLFAVPGCRRRG
jgi:hypothetical protein